MGCSRQPIAAVRRVGAAASMLNSFSVVVRMKGGDLMLMSRASGFGASSFEALGAAISQSVFARAKVKQNSNSNSLSTFQESVLKGFFCQFPLFHLQITTFSKQNNLHLPTTKSPGSLDSYLKSV